MASLNGEAGEGAVADNTEGPRSRSNELLPALNLIKPLIWNSQCF